jgi:peptidoglycan hydrolase-like protein with peptidoglycan-binding domain/DNA invertase Pin-like site-specific DNA recombinase
MRRTYLPACGRGLVAGVAAGLVLWCLSGTIVAGGSSASASERLDAGATLARGAGFAEAGRAVRVRALQRRLQGLGLAPGPVDGLFGPLTEAAVVRLQRAHGLVADGIVGTATRRALRGSVLFGPGAGYGHRGGSARVRALQLRLRALGLRPGPVDGLFGPLTEAALVRFQQTSRLAADGVAGPHTMVALAATRHTAVTPARERLDRRRLEQETRQQSKTQQPRPTRAHPAGRGHGRSLTWLLVAAGLAGLGLLGLATQLAGPVSAKLRDRARPHATRGHSRPAQHATEVVTRPAPGVVPANGSSLNGALTIGYIRAPEHAAPTHLRAQVAPIVAFCRRCGWRLQEVARDLEQSPTDAPPRPGLDHALARLDRGRAPCLVVAELAQLSTSPAELGRIVAWLMKRRIRVLVLDVELDTATPLGHAAAHGLVLAGARGDDPFIELTRRDLEARTEGAGTAGRPAVEDVPALRRYIADLRASGMTLQAIADQLNSERVPTLRGGREWRPSSLQAAAGYRRPHGGRGESDTARGLEGDRLHHRRDRGQRR